MVCAVLSSASEPMIPMDLIDGNISLRLRQRRLLLGCTQSAVADALGVSFQQIQKYETGANRVNVARLFELSCVLDVPITYFYENLKSVRKVEGAKTRLSGNGGKGVKKGKNGAPPFLERRVKHGVDTMNVDEMMKRSETLTLVRNFYLLKPAVRKSIASMCRGLGS